MWSPSIQKKTKIGIDRSGMGLVKDKAGLEIGIGFGKHGEGKAPRPLKGVFRDRSETEEWGTKLEELSAEEVERRETGD
jgi:chromatin structure-remodeling complex subunit SFH1